MSTARTHKLASQPATTWQQQAVVAASDPQRAAAACSNAAHTAAPRIDDAMRANERVAQQAGEHTEPSHGEASLVAAAAQRAVEKATAAMTGR